MVYSCFRDNIIKYKWLIVLLVAYFSILVYCSPLDITQLNSGDKCFAHLYSSVTGVRIYNAPLYTLLGWVVTRLPFSDGFSLSFFLSIIPSVICVALVYFAIKKQTDTKGAPLFGALSLAASWLFVSQAVKVEVYPALALLLILGYTFAVYKKGVLAAITFGFALSGHWVDAIPVVFAMFFYSREFRRRSYLTLIVFAGVFIAWKFLPNYRNGIFEDTFLSSAIRLFEFWGSGTVYDFILNLSRIPIIMFMIGFGWIPAILYFVKEYKKAAPIIFIVGVLCLFILISLNDAGYQQIGTIIPFLAVAAGLGFKYLANVNFKRIVICGTLITLLLIPLCWNIDTNPTSARDMIDQLDDIPDNSIVACYREPDAYANAISWTVDYYNFENDKHLYPLVVCSLWYANDSNIKEITDMGILVPEIGNGSPLMFNYPKTMDAIAALNPNISFYYYELVDDRSAGCDLKIWQ